MAIPVVHRESPHHAPDRPPSPRLRPVTIYVVRQPVCGVRYHLLRHSRPPVLHRDCDCWDVVV